MRLLLCCRTSLLSAFGLVMNFVHSADSVVWLVFWSLLWFVWWFSLLRPVLIYSACFCSFHLLRSLEEHKKNLVILIRHMSGMYLFVCSSCVMRRSRSLCPPCVCHLSSMRLLFVSISPPYVCCCGAEPWHHQVKLFLTIAQPAAFILHACWVDFLGIHFGSPNSVLQAHSVLQKPFGVYAGVICFFYCLVSLASIFACQFQEHPSAL